MTAFIPRLLAGLSTIWFLSCGGPPADKPTGRSSLYDWENLEVLQRNREPAHSTFIPFREAGEVLGSRRPEESSYFLSLNGTWKFHWSPVPAERPEAFHAGGFDDAGWDDIRPILANREKTLPRDFAVCKDAGWRGTVASALIEPGARFLFADGPPDRVAYERVRAYPISGGSESGISSPS